MTIFNDEQLLSLPWLIIPAAEEGSETPKLLVRTPQGSILEFPIPESEVETVAPLLNSDILWETFFTSVLESLGGNR